VQTAAANRQAIPPTKWSPENPAKTPPPFTSIEPLNAVIHPMMGIEIRVENKTPGKIRSANGVELSKGPLIKRLMPYNTAAPAQMEVVAAARMIAALAPPIKKRETITARPLKAAHVDCVRILIN
jgi:hypothetical protein